MNWVKENPFLAGFAAVVLVGGGVLAYFLNTAFVNYTAVSETYDSEVTKLQSLQNKEPFPSAANNEAFAAFTDEYEAAFEALLAEAAAMQFPLEQISPQAFQDRLRAVVSEVEASAAANGVTLPEGFYMGFDNYQGTLPSAAAASPLARQLAAVKTIVDRLIEFRIHSISGINRQPLPEERGGAAPAQNPNRRGNQGGNQKNAPEGEAPKIAESFPFEISFITEQGRLRQVLNAVVNAEQFFVLRNLTVVSNQPDGPSRIADAAAAATPAVDNSFAAVLGQEAAPEQPAGLNVIVGRELLNVTARIEMFTFTPPEPQQ